MASPHLAVGEKYRYNAYPYRTSLVRLAVRDWERYATAAWMTPIDSLDQVVVYQFFSPSIIPITASSKRGLESVDRQRGRNHLLRTKLNPLPTSPTPESTKARGNEKHLGIIRS